MATLTRSDVEAAMKKGLEAVDQLDAAVTLEKVSASDMPHKNNARLQSDIAGRPNN